MSGIQGGGGGRGGASAGGNGGSGIVILSYPTVYPAPAAISAPIAPAAAAPLGA